MKNPEIDIYGTKCWYNNEMLLHREDGPALEFADGTKAWWNNGRRHRENGPAIEYTNGDKWWCVNGKLHRLDGPAIEFNCGEKQWWYNNYIIGKSKNGFTQEKFDRYLRELKIKEYW